MIKGGSDYAAELALQNLNDLTTILHWNDYNDIRFFKYLLVCFLGPQNILFLNYILTTLLVKSAELAGEVASNYNMRFLPLIPDHSINFALQKSL